MKMDDTYAGYRVWLVETVREHDRIVYRFEIIPLEILAYQAAFARE